MVARIADGPPCPTAACKTGTLVASAMTKIEICRAIRRRFQTAGLPDVFSPHALRVTPVANLAGASRARRNLADHGVRD
jgi:hypothetical protein